MSELDDWKQAASVEAGLRREFYDRALTAESLLQEAYAGHRKQKAEITRLRKALMPFARLVEMIECTTSHEYSDTDSWHVPIGDLRRARAALTSTKSKEHGRHIPQTSPAPGDDSGSHSFAPTDPYKLGKEWCPVCHHDDGAHDATCRYAVPSTDGKTP